MTELEDLNEVMEDCRAGRANYLMINLVARRVRLLNKGFKPLVEMETGTDLVDVAYEELRQGKLKVIRRRKNAGAEAPAAPRQAPVSEEEE